MEVNFCGFWRLTDSSTLQKKVLLNNFISPLSGIYVQVKVKLSKGFSKRSKKVSISNNILFINFTWRKFALCSKKSLSLRTLFKKFFWDGFKGFRGYFKIFNIFPWQRVWLLLKTTLIFHFQESSLPKYKWILLWFFDKYLIFK